MAHSVTEWLTALQQVMPRGKAWPRDNDADLNRFLRALAARLTRIEYDASRLHVEMRPETTLQLLPEWEQYLALPECGIAATTTEARRRAVVEKYRRKGGLATWQIEAAAAALGFTIKVTAVSAASLPARLHVPAASGAVSLAAESGGSGQRRRAFYLC